MGINNIHSKFNQNQDTKRKGLFRYNIHAGKGTKGLRQLKHNFMEKTLPILATHILQIRKYIIVQSTSDQINVLKTYQNFTAKMLNHRELFSLIKFLIKTCV